MALVALLAAPGIAQGASLSRKIERVFREGSQGGGTWALVVRPLDGEGGGKERFEANASLRMIAASTCKLFVCHAAAAMLPPETSFVMTVSRSWVVSGRVARGSVQINGGGAPGLASFGNGVDSGRGIFDAFAKAVRLAGVDSLAVRLCIRNDLFNPGDSIGAGWQWDDLPWYYAARVTATALDDNACRFRFVPRGLLGVDALAAPELPAGWSVSSDMRLAPGFTDVGCNGDGPRSFYFSGSLHQGDSTHSERASLARPELYVADRFRDALERAGVRTHLDLEPFAAAEDSPAQAIDTVGRVDLGEVFHPILARSQNLRAEMLLRDLGARRGQRGSVAEGLRCIRRDLDSLGIAASEVRLADGSGLSRLDWVSANALARVLEDAGQRAARGDSGMAHLMAGLARPGGNGSLVARFLDPKGEDPRPAEWMLGKTGSMDGVDALAAIVTSREGRKFLVVSLRNFFPGGRAEGRAWEEALIRIVADSE